MPEEELKVDEKSINDVIKQVQNGEDIEELEIKVKERRKEPISSSQKTTKTESIIEPKEEEPIITTEEEEIASPEERYIEESYDNAPISEVLNSNDEERIKKAAKARGWFPNKDKFKPEDGKKFVDAYEFLARREMSDSISALKKLNKKKDGQIEKFVNLTIKQHDMLLKEREEWAAAQKNAAKESSNIEEYEKYKTMEEENKKEREELKKTYEEPEKKEQQEVPPIVLDYVRRNQSWMISQADIDNKVEKIRSPINRAMTEFLRAETQNLERLHPEMTPEQFVATIDATMKREFPNKFVNPERTRASAIAIQRGENLSRKSEKISITFNNLHRDVQDIVNEMLKYAKGKKTADQYAQDLYDEGTIKFNNGKWEIK